MTLGGLFFKSYERDPSQIFIRHADGRQYTYEQAACAIADLITKLGELNIQKGDRIIYFMDKPIPAIFMILACALSGVVFLPLSPIFSTEYLKDLIDQIQAKAIFTTESINSSALGIPVQFMDEKALLPKVARPTSAWESLLGSVHAQDILMIQPTSGTTGKPKPVVRTHHSILRYFQHVGVELEGGVSGTAATERPKFLMVAALTHAFGFHMFGTALGLGAELSIPSGLDVNVSLDEIRALDPVVLPMTPRVLRSIHRQYASVEDQKPFLGPSAKTIVIAGGTGDAEIFRFVRNYNIEVIEIYGSSETSIIALTPRGGWKEGYAGRVLHDVEVKVAPDGELLIKSPGQMLCYYGNEEATANAYDSDGYYKVGDMGHVSADGYIRIFGRKQDAFGTTEGSLVFPERIESKVESLPWVRQVALSGVYIRYLTALIVVNDELGLASAEPDGYLDETKNSDFYRKAREDLATVNEKLEPLEHVHRFALFTQPFPTEVYATVGPNKIRRDRKVLYDQYGKHIVDLYSPNISRDHLKSVPGAERRRRDTKLVVPSNAVPVLIVDDHQSSLQFSKILLEEFGFKTIYMETSATAALHLIKRLQSSATDATIGLIISDWQMPVIDGVQFFRSLKADPETANIPFMLLTADNEFIRVLEAVKSGINYFLTKPLTKEKLRAAMDRLIKVEIDKQTAKKAA